MQAQIPPRKNRKERRDYDKHLSDFPHLFGDLFSPMIATRS